MTLWTPTPIAVGGLLVAAFGGYTALLAWRSRDAPGGGTMAALLVVLTWSAGTYSVMLGVPGVDRKAVWFALSMGGVAFIAPLWILFTLEYTATADWRREWTWRLVLAESVVTAGLSLTNPTHGLLWTVEGVPATGPSALAVAFRPAFLARTTYAYLLVVAGVGMLAVRLSGSADVLDRQTRVLVVAPFPGLVANVSFTFGVPLGPLPTTTLDLTSYLAVLAGGGFALAAYRFDLIDRNAVARQNALEQMGDGLLVLDTDGRVVETNEVARRVLDPAPEVGEPVAAEPLASADPPYDGIDDEAVRSEVDGRERTYDVAHSPIHDHRGAVVGHTVALRDVTDRDRYRQRLEVAQRVYRHNVRNRLNVIKGWAERIERRSTNGHSTAVGKVLEATDDLISLSEKTRAMVRIGDGQSAEAERTDVVEEVTRLAGRVRADHPNATVDISVPREAVVRTADHDVLQVAVENVVENAVEHNDALEPWVGITVERSPDAVEIRVADDGPGIPAEEREVIEAGAETPLRHGSGIGLWLVHWSVTTLGGDVTFAERDPRGSVVTLTIPTAPGTPGGDVTRARDDVGGAA